VKPGALTVGLCGTTRSSMTLIWKPISANVLIVQAMVASHKEKLLFRRSAHVLRVEGE
jgi:hypothetical protein